MAKSLRGVRVLDLTNLLPGPYCTMLLADQGAEVVKIERPGVGDPNRWEAASNGTRGYVFDMVNRNKRSVELDLKSDAGLAALKDLVATADVFVEGFRPGKLAKLGLDYDSLRSVNPGLVYCSISSFGQDTPARHRPAHDLNCLGYAGVLDMIGVADGAPAVPGVQIADMMAATQAALGIAFALLGRQATGQGAYLDISLLNAALSLATPMAGWYYATGETPTRGDGVVSGGTASYNVYRTKDGRYLTVAAWEPQFWANFCALIGRPDLVDRGTATGAAGRDAIAAVQAVLAERTQAEWLGLLEPEETCVGPVLTLAEALRSPLAEANAMTFRILRPSREPLAQVASPIAPRISHMAAEAPPELGADNGWLDAVLANGGPSNRSEP